MNTENKKELNLTKAAGKKIKRSNRRILADETDSLGSYILEDVLIPAIKKLIADILHNGTDILIYGKPVYRGDSRSRVMDNVSYRSYSKPGSSDFRTLPNGKSTYSYDKVAYSTRAEAEEVLEGMCQILDQYDRVSVADLYDLSQVTGSHTDDNYGWYNLSTAEIIRTMDGYSIRLPKAEVIKK